MISKNGTSLQQIGIFARPQLAFMALHHFEKVVVLFKNLRETPYHLLQPPES